ncbi:unnamed protein product [Toxocara canis]|uniref:Peptidylprolyl isomerase n=1 Tax=Toxocara canis TaxID=6265 RepID=A0A183V2W8_TOXCA|nr:unnamed protein product [Toxocara canis]
MFQVSPAYGLMKPGGTRELQPGKVGGNYLSIYYITAPSCYDPRMPFVKGAQIGEVKFKIMETLQDESALDDQGQDSPDQSEKRPRTKSTKKSSNEKSDQLVSKRRRTKKKPEEGTLEKDRALPRKKRVEGLCRKIRSAERIEEEARKSSRRKERSPDRIEQTETQKDCQYDYLVVRESAVDSANKSKQDGKSIKKPEPENPNKHDNNK